MCGVALRAWSSNITPAPLDQLRYEPLDLRELLVVPQCRERPHTAKGTPAFILFRSLNRRRTARALAELGYPINKLPRKEGRV